MRDTLPTLKRNTIPSFFKVCPKNFIKQYNQDTQVVTFTNGSQILFFSENYDDDKQLDRWKGLEVNGFLLEEVNELQQASFYKAIERAGAHIIPNKPQPLIMATCNPSNNWVKELIYEPAKNGTLPSQWKYIQSRIFDNPFVLEDSVYMESLKMMPRYQYEQFVEGNWDLQLKTGGEFYKCFELDSHVADAKYNPLLPLHISWDDNVNPYLPCGIFQIEGKTISMVDEIAGVTPNNTISAVCREIIRKYPAHDKGMFIYGDATANKEDTKLEKGMNFYKLITEALRQYKPSLRVLNSNPSVVMRGNWINTILEKEIGGIKIIIGSHCKKTINDFVATKEAADGTKYKEMETNTSGVRYQKVGHMVDLTDYILCSAFAAEFAAYQRGGAVQSLPTFGKNATSKNSY